MQINNYLDATYLKTASQANITEQETQNKITSLLEEAIHYNYKLVMIRAKYIPFAKSFLTQNNANTLVGTVIGFHEGDDTIESKINEAKQAIALGADELDFVINYTEFKKGNIALVENEVKSCSAIGLQKNKAVKWIIEAAALTNTEIVKITQLIKNVITLNFEEEQFKKVFVKSSTGFYNTENNLPNGATFENMQLIAANARPLKIKAAGGVRDYDTALKMIQLGVDRIGTSSSKEICLQTKDTKSGY